MAQNGIRPPSLLAMVRGLLPSIVVNGVLVFVIYLLVKHFTSASDIVALVISAIPAMIFTIFGLLRQRQVDILGAFALITIAFSILRLDTALVAAFLHGQPKAMELITPWVKNSEVATSILVYGSVARNEVISAVTVLCSCRSIPHLPDSKALSVTVIIQFAGSVLPVCQTLAESVEPTTRKRSV
jgi:hypothetical protein